MGYFLFSGKQQRLQRGRDLLKCPVLSVKEAFLSRYFNSRVINRLGEKKGFDILKCELQMCPETHLTLF